MNYKEHDKQRRNQHKYRGFEPEIKVNVEKSEEKKTQFNFTLNNPRHVSGFTHKAVYIFNIYGFHFKLSDKYGCLMK